MLSTHQASPAAEDHDHLPALNIGVQCEVLHPPASSLDCLDNLRSAVTELETALFRFGLPNLKTKTEWPSSAARFASVDALDTLRSFTNAIVSSSNRVQPDAEAYVFTFW